jgi:sugar lactone lactonase YvrE
MIAMRKMGYGIFLLLCTAGWLFAVKIGDANGGEPRRLDYHSVPQNNEAVIALLAQRVIRGLESGDPSLYRNLIAGANQNTSINETIFTTVNTDLYGSVSMQFIKVDDRWMLADSDELSSLAQFFNKQANTGSAKAKDQKGFSLFNAGTENGKNEMTFIAKAMAPEYQINILSRQVTAERLRKQLFSMPYGSALFAKVQQFNTAPFFAATYVQLVSDMAWNRIVYGDYQKWIKAYDASESGLALNRPHGIVVDAQGLVYVADTGNGRVLALKLNGPQHDLRLSYLGAIGELSQPTELAWDDRGTIFDFSDDLLWIIDRGTNTLFAYRASLPAAERVLEYKDDAFVTLSALAIGRFDGRSDGNIYLADAGTRRVHRLYFDGQSLSAVSEFQGEPEMVPTALATDHWGNVYLSDETHRQIEKFSPALELLATLYAPDAAFQPVRFQPLFGSVAGSESEQPRWSGYDQAFLLEQWTEQSGGRRYELGIDFHLDDLRLAEDLSELMLSGRLTDAGYLKVEIVSQQTNEALGALVEAWQNAGGVHLRWDRRTASGEMATPGFYQVRHQRHSTYGKPPVVEESAAFYLPLYYYEDCGAAASRDAHLARGTRTTAHGGEPERSVVEDATEVIYSFQNLNPEIAYEVRARYFSGVASVEQILYAEAYPLHPARLVDQSPQMTDWLAIPQETVADGKLALRFVKSGGSGNASVAEIWLREANYDPNNPPAIEQPAAQLPEHFALQQNYPNPFNPTTTIEFSIPEGYHGAVTLRIYNTLGELVRELAAGEFRPGNYRETWDGLDRFGNRLASGLYLYQLKAGNYSATRKLMLMK